MSFTSLFETPLRRDSRRQSAKCDRASAYGNVSSGNIFNMWQSKTDQMRARRILPSPTIALKFSTESATFSDDAATNMILVIFDSSRAAILQLRRRIQNT